MSPIIKGLKGPEIEKMSMEIIEKELGPTDFSFLNYRLSKGLYTPLPTLNLPRISDFIQRL